MKKLNKLKKFLLTFMFYLFVFIIMFILDIYFFSDCIQLMGIEMIPSELKEDYEDRYIYISNLYKDTCEIISRVYDICENSVERAIISDNNEIILIKKDNITDGEFQAINDHIMGLREKVFENIDSIYGESAELERNEAVLRTYGYNPGSPSFHDSSVDLCHKLDKYDDSTWIPLPDNLISNENNN